MHASPVCRVRAEHVASLGPSRARRSCKYSPGDSGGPGDSASLKACNDLLMEYMPKLTKQMRSPQMENIRRRKIRTMTTGA